MIAAAASLPLPVALIALAFFALGWVCRGNEYRRGREDALAQVSRTRRTIEAQQ